MTLTLTLSCQSSLSLSLRPLILLTYYTRLLLSHPRFLPMWQVYVPRVHCSAVVYIGPKGGKGGRGERGEDLRGSAAEEASLPAMGLIDATCQVKRH